MQQLYEGYPKMFEHCFEVSVPPGWESVVFCLTDYLQYTTDNNNEPQVVVNQVKEKYGGLRYYVDSASDEQYGAINFACRLAYGICEKCGSMQDVTTKATKSWVRTLCTSCRAAELKQYKIEARKGQHKSDSQIEQGEGVQKSNLNIKQEKAT